MGAELLIRNKQLLAGLIIELVIWELTASLPGCSHYYKYRLYCGTVEGVCLVRYDNERGKGDHRHVEEIEQHYDFKDIETLLSDFRKDVREKGGI